MLRKAVVNEHLFYCYGFFKGHVRFDMKSFYNEVGVGVDTHQSKHMDRCHKNMLDLFGILFFEHLRESFK